MQTVIIAPRHVHPVSLSPFSDQSKLASKPIRVLLARPIALGVDSLTMPSSFLVGLAPWKSDRREAWLDEVLAIIVTVTHITSHISLVSSGVMEMLGE